MQTLFSVAMLLVTAGAVDLNGAVASEARVGQAPLVAGGAPRAGAVGIVTPLVLFAFRERTLQLGFSYGPRIFWREPNEAQSLAPLVLHNAILNASARLSAESRLAAELTGSYGQADYTALPQLIGPNPVTIPFVKDFLAVGGSIALDTTMSRRLQTSWTAGVVYRSPVGAPETPPADAANPNVLFDKQTVAQFMPAVNYSVSRRDTVGITAPIVYTHTSFGFDLMTASPQLTIRSLPSRTSFLRVSAGVGISRFLGAPMGKEAPNKTAVVPIGGVEYGGRIASLEDGVVTSLVGLSASYFTDPNLGVTLSRGTALGRVSWLFDSRWSAALDGNFATSLTSHPLGTNVDETSVAASVLVRRRLGDNAVGEVGVRWADLGPHLRADSFSFHQRQLWLYVSLLATTNTRTLRSAR